MEVTSQQFYSGEKYVGIHPLNYHSLSFQVMAALMPTYKEVSRLSSRYVRRNGFIRGKRLIIFHTYMVKRTIADKTVVQIGFQSCSRSLAAQNFTMPAMSPTMTEGNIASWKVKEG